MARLLDAAAAAAVAPVGLEAALRLLVLLRVWWLALLRWGIVLVERDSASWRIAV